jgi:3-hydroxyisobutyrate dehydrogenase
VGTVALGFSSLEHLKQGRGGDTTPTADAHHVTRELFATNQDASFAPAKSNAYGGVRDAVAAVGARAVWPCESGAAGTATRLKLFADSWFIATTAAAGEALSQALGVDPQSFFDAIAGCPRDMGCLRPSSPWRLPPRTPA